MRGPPGVELGPATPLARGRVRAPVLLDGRAVGEVRHAAWDDHLVVDGIDLHHAPPGTEAEVVRAVLATRPPPDRLTHARVRDPATLRFYAASPWGPGALVSGVLGGAAFTYDTLDRVPGALLDLPPGDACELVVLARRGADHRLRDLTDAALARRLTGGTWVDRVATLRALARRPDLPRPTVDAAHHLALLDPEHAVRQFAAMQLSGVIPDQPFTPDVAALVGLLHAPLAPHARFGAPPEVAPDLPWDPARGRRNLRLAVVWTLGNLATAAPLAPDGSWLRAVPARLRDALEASLPGLTPAADAALRRHASAELTGDHAAGLGADAPLDLLALLRALVLRHRLVRAMGEAAHDRFHWLTLALEPILPSPLGPTRGDGEGHDDDPLARRLYGPSPPGPTPRGPLPPSLRGANPYAAPAPGPVGGDPA